MQPIEPDDFREPMMKPRSFSQMLFEPSPETITAFLSGALMVGLLTNLLSEFLSGNIPSWRSVVSHLGVSLILFLVAYTLYRRLLSEAKRVAFILEENTPTPRQRRGLIWILTPSGTSHTMVALRHHFGSGNELNSLRHCWLIQQRNNQQVVDERHILEKRLLVEQIQIEVHNVYVDELTVREAYNAIVQIVEQDMGAHGVPRSQIVVDITGGTKPMTAGVILAALSTDCLLEYVETDRDTQGKPLPDTARVVNVSRQAYLQAQ